MASAYRIELLGGLRVRFGECCVDRFRTKKTGALLALLVLRRGNPIPRDEASDLLWPEDSQSTGRNNLRIALTALRKLFDELGGPSEVVSADRNTISLAGESFTSDVAEFEQLAKSAADAEALGRAVSLYKGDLLPGFYEEWASAERSRLADLQVALVNKLGRQLIEQEQYDQALDCARIGIYRDPFGEESYRIGILAHLFAGRRGAAHELYNRLRNLLADELGVEPEVATSGLLNTVPKFSSSNSASTPVARVPCYSSRFFGREQELDELFDLLSKNRLLTIVGPGGVGKTRLAVEFANYSGSKLDGRIHFVDATEARDFESLADSLIHCICPDENGLEPLARAVSYIGSRQTLLILDNLEQVIDAAALFLRHLFDSCPNLTVLATSRKRLGFPGEHAIILEPLAPPPEQSISDAALLQIPSVELLLDRVREAQPNLVLTPDVLSHIAAVARTLEGVPLAIELAAARTRVLPLEEVARQSKARLAILANPRSTVHPRHRSLRAALDWGHSLLSDEDRGLLSGLSVFRGGWTLHAAGALFPETDVLNGIDALAADSFIGIDHTDGDVRYRMLETVRQFADEQLDDMERSRLLDRHSAYFLGLAQTASAQLEGGEQAIWLRRLEREWPNIRSAHEWLMKDGRKAEIFELLGRIWPFMARRLSLTEARRMVESAIAMEGFSTGDDSGLRLLDGATKLAEQQGDYPATEKFARTGLEASLEIGNPIWESEFLTQLGVVEKRRANLEGARAFWNQAYDVAIENDSRPQAARNLLHLATLARFEEDFSTSRALYDQALPIFEELGDPHKVGLVLQNLGLLACDECNFDSSIAYLLRAVDLRAEIGDVKGVAFSLGALGQTCLAAGEFQRACGYYSECLDICLKLENRTGLEHCLWDLSHAFLANGQFEWAARMLGVLKKAHREMGLGLQSFEQSEWDSAQSRLAKRLGEAALVRFMAEGQGLTLEEAARHLREKLCETSPTR